MSASARTVKLARSAGLLTAHGQGGAEPGDDGCVVALGGNARAALWITECMDASRKTVKRLRCSTGTRCSALWVVEPWNTPKKNQQAAPLLDGNALSAP